jgi:hypothetical protein
VQVKSFAAAAVGPPVAGYPCPPYKLLILDEADSMTQVGWKIWVYCVLSFLLWFMLDENMF